MIAWVLGLALAGGPPKLPPLPGRSMPAPEPEPPPKAPAPEASAGKTPAPKTPEPKTVAPKTQTPTASAKPVAPKVPSKAPSSKRRPKVQRPRSLGGRAKPSSATGVSSKRSAEPLAAASDDEIRQWTRSIEDRGGTEPEPAQPGAATPGDAPRKAAKRRGSPDFSDATVTRTASVRSPTPRLTMRGYPRPPKRSAAFVIGYRQFSILDDLDRRQLWHLASVEVTPLRRYFRLNLITELGVEGGEAARAGDRADLMIVQKLGLGLQYPHWVTPMVEFQAGVGGARVELFERNDVVFLYTLGVDAGAQWAVTRWLHLHAAIGWIRPVFMRPGRPAQFDRLTFKVGIGF